MTTFLYQPPEKPRKIKSMQARGPGRRVKRVVEHLTKGLTPVNPELLKEIKQLGFDADSRKKLGELLTSDPALFLHFLRRVSSEVDSAELSDDPIQALKTLEDEKLTGILDVPAHQISTYSIESINKAQAELLQYTVISSKTAQALAGKTEIPDGIAYASSILRHMTLNLIAWNYPSIYARAVARNRGDAAGLEQELEQQLQVSLKDITVQLAREWGIHHHLRAQYAHSQGEKTALYGEGNGHESLDEICNLGELFAQANDPRMYPEAQEKWASLHAEIAEKYGANVFDDIEHQIDQAVSHFSQAQKIFEPAELKLKSLKQEDVSSRPELTLNKYAKQLPAELQLLFQEMYQRIQQARISVDAIRYLVDEVVAEAGFDQGCLYLLDKSETNLVPALRFGSNPLSSYRPLRADSNSKIAESIYSRIPISWETSREDGVEIVSSACGLGDSKHTGVLFLESPVMGEDFETTEFLKRFKAVHASLVDALS